MSSFLLLSGNREDILLTNKMGIYLAILLTFWVVSSDLRQWMELILDFADELPPMTEAAKKMYS